MSRSRSGLDGALVVHKPVGPTSHDVVICARRALGLSRIGHTGTLDPHAAGVLPLLLGQATRLAQHLTASDKEYLATIRFGVVSDTYDVAGSIEAQGAPLPSPAAIEQALQRFTGTFEQRPPIYSAKMVGGERSYARARAGAPVQPPAVPVTVHTLHLVGVEGDRATVRVRCSAGFYVRSLAHDLGQAVGSGAVLQALVRLEAGGFTLADATPFETLVTAPRAVLIESVRPLAALLPAVPAATLTAEGVRRARHGRDLGPAELMAPLLPVPPLVRLVGPDGRMVGVGEPAKRPGFLHPAVIFS